jgi:hypothetical protein
MLLTLRSKMTLAVKKLHPPLCPSVASHQPSKAVFCKVQQMDTLNLKRAILHFYNGWISNAEKPEKWAL